MATPTLLVASWSDGLRVVEVGGSVTHELRGQVVRSLAADGEGGALAVVDGRTLRQRSSSGAWRVLAVSESDISCGVAAAGQIYVGTDDAEILRLDANGQLQRLPGFANVAGRDTWYAGTAIIDGKVVGPPLGIRSMSATCDGAVLLANVHVGGIPRSTDGGVTWHPTLDVEADVHEVRAHATRADIVIAATASGLGISRDRGKTWSIERQGLHAPHCAAVAFAGADILVTAAESPFSEHGAIYRRPLETSGPLLPVGGGLPARFDGTVDTNCVATLGSTLALATGGGSLYLSQDAGQTWSELGFKAPAPSSLLLV